MFSVPQAYTCHTQSCPKTKKRLSCALGKAKEVWEPKKCRKMEELAQSEAVGCSSNQNVPTELPLNDTFLPAIYLQVRFVAHSALSLVKGLYICQDYEDLDQPLAERRSHQEHCQLPKHYSNIAPEPPAALPPASSQVPSESTWVELDVSQNQFQGSLNCLSRARGILKSTCNAFGLFRQYHANQFPEHDPGENFSPDNLVDPPSNISSSLPAHDYHPYPNQSSFLLGEWYWNGGEKKSQSGFQNLLKIVGHPEFCPEDVTGNNWRHIDAQLSGEHCENSKDADLDSWEDKQDNGHWMKTPIKINVPFHRQMQHPGPKEFNAGILHHRRLVLVIREKIT